MDNFTNKKFIPTWYVYPSGKSKNAHIIIKKTNYHREAFDISITIEETQKLIDILTTTLQSAIERSKMDDDEDGF